VSEDPFFLSVDLVNELHAEGLAEHGGADGIGDPGGLESAVNAPENVFSYEGGDLFEIAAAYAFHIAEAQAYDDGNKRAAVSAALIFLDGNGVNVEAADPMSLYVHMISISSGELDRPGLATKMHELFAGQ